MATTRDYELIAQTFRAKLDPMNYPQDEVRTALLKDIANSLAISFKLHNDRFNEDKFISACGFKDG